MVLTFTSWTYSHCSTLAVRRSKFRHWATYPHLWLQGALQFPHLFLPISALLAAVYSSVPATLSFTTFVIVCYAVSFALSLQMTSLGVSCQMGRRRRCRSFGAQGTCSYPSSSHPWSNCAWMVPQKLLVHPPALVAALPSTAVLLLRGCCHVDNLAGFLWVAQELWLPVGFPIYFAYRKLAGS